MPTCSIAQGIEGQPAASTPTLNPGQASESVSMACLTSSRRWTSSRVRLPFSAARRANSAATIVLPPPVGKHVDSRAMSGDGGAQLGDGRYLVVPEFSQGEDPPSAVAVCRASQSRRTT